MQNLSIIGKSYHRHIIEVYGPEAKSFLQGILSSDIEQLDKEFYKFKEQQNNAKHIVEDDLKNNLKVFSDADQKVIYDTPCQYSLLLTPQGKILYDFFIFSGCDQHNSFLASENGKGANLYYLACHPDFIGEIMQKLQMYKLRAEVKICNRNDMGAVFIAGQGFNEIFLIAEKISSELKKRIICVSKDPRLHIKFKNKPEDIVDDQDVLDRDILAIGSEWGEGNSTSRESLVMKEYFKGYDELFENKQVLCGQVGDKKNNKSILNSSIQARIFLLGKEIESSSYNEKNNELGSNHPRNFEQKFLDTGVIESSTNSDFSPGQSSASFVSGCEVGNLLKKSNFFYDYILFFSKIPQFGREFFSKEYFPFDFFLEELSAVSYEKGCYVGQEVITRTKFRGKNVRRLVHMLLAEGENQQMEIGDRKLKQQVGSDVSEDLEKNNSNNIEVIFRNDFLNISKVCGEVIIFSPQKNLVLVLLRVEGLGENDSANEYLIEGSKYILI